MAAPQLGGVEHVVVHERRHVEKLDSRARRHQAGAVSVAAEEDQYRAQPLSSRGERPLGVPGELPAVAASHLGQAILRAHEQRGELGAARGQHRAELRLSGVHGSRVPACSAMMPPAVRIQRTSTSPAAAMRAASSSGPGKRRTLDGR